MIKIRFRWIGLRLEFAGSLIVLGSSLFIVLKKDSISAGTAGLTMSYALTVILFKLNSISSNKLISDKYGIDLDCSILH